MNQTDYVLSPDAGRGAQRSLLSSLLCD